MAPLGALLMVVSLTADKTPPFLRHKWKDKSKIDLKAFDLCGIAAIGEILFCGGGLSLILSHAIRHACLVCSFSLISSAKCLSASGDLADQCGPHSTASHISSFVHWHPVRVGNPNVAQSRRSFAAGWFNARPVGHIKF